MIPHINPLLTARNLAPSSKTAPNPLADKINDYVADLIIKLSPLFLSFKPDELPKMVYKIAQLSLSTLGCAGYVVTLLIFIGGFTKIAVVTALLSTANFVGAYVAYQATIQHSLAMSAKQFEKHLNELGQINTELKVTSDDLKKTNQNLKEQVSLFEEQNLELRDNIYALESVKSHLQLQVASLNQSIAVFRNCNQELKATIEQIKQDMAQEIAAFSTQNQQWRSFAEVCKQEAEEYFSQTQHYSHTQATLLRQFGEQIAASDNLWKDVYSRIREQAETQTQLIQFQRDAFAELPQAIKKDIESASAEFKALLAQINKAQLELAALKIAYDITLQEYKGVLEQFREENSRLRAHVTALTGEGSSPGAAQGAP